MRRERIMGFNVFYAAPKKELGRRQNFYWFEGHPKSSFLPEGWEEDVQNQRATMHPLSSSEGEVEYLLDACFFEKNNPDPRRVIRGKR